MFVVVSYDIPHNRRRTRVMKTLKDFGRHVQYSVFECELRDEDLRRLRRRLKELVNPRQDNIRFYYISKDDAQKRQVWGVERNEVDVRPWYIVGAAEPEPE